MRAEQYISSLETTHFGFKVARIEGATADLDHLLADLTAAAVKLVIARLATADVPLLHQFEARGFRLMDVQVTQRFDLADLVDRGPRSRVSVRDFEPRDLESVIRVATESFAGYGHYAADTRLDPTLCRAAYIDWARRSCQDSSTADAVLVAIHEGVVVGFLTFKIREDNGVRYAPGGIGAVAPAHRNRGAFSALVEHGLQWGAHIGLGWEEHNALVTNYPVNRVFARAGFYVSHSAVTMHAWL